MIYSCAFLDRAENEQRSERAEWTILTTPLGFNLAHFNMAAKWSAQVDEFVSVTGASIERAGSLLEACNGNLTMAIEMHFDSASESVPIASNSASADTSTANEIDK